MKKSFIFSLLFLIIALSETKTVSRVKLQQSSKPVYQNFLGTDKLDLTYPYLINADFGSVKGVPLAVNLFNSHFFVSTCGDKFATFNCSEHTDVCVPFVKLPYSADLPNLRLNGYRMLLNVTMGNYGRGNRVKGFVATQCVGMPYDSDKVVGAVGLSLNHSNYKHFDTENNRFSIYLKSDAPTGELIFGQDNAYSDGVEPLRMMGVTRNWEVPVDGLTMLDLVLDFTGHAIFDLNSNYLGVPDNIYNSLLLDLKNRFKFNCQLSTRIPNCTYTGDIAKLPAIVLMTSESNNPISIPSQIYCKKIGDNLYQLLFVSLTPSPISKHQIFVTDTYKDYIVLGAPFLSYYYTVFLYEDHNNPEIQLYGPTGGDNKKTGGLSAWAIVGIVLGALLVIGLIVGGIYAFKKNKDKRKTESLVAPDTRVGYISYNQ